MSGHTAGQWSYEYENDVGPDDDYFIEWYGMNGVFKADREEDAILIVAAPSMLATLELVKRRLNTCLCDELEMGEGTMNRLFEEVSEAIARAKGEQV